MQVARRELQIQSTRKPGQFSACWCGICTTAKYNGFTTDALLGALWLYLVPKHVPVLYLATNHDAASLKPPMGMVWKACSCLQTEKAQQPQQDIKEKTHKTVCKVIMQSD